MSTTVAAFGPQNDQCYVMAIASRYVARPNPTPRRPPPKSLQPEAVPKSHRPSPLPSTDSSDGKYLATSLSTQAVKMYQRTEDGGIAALLELTGHGAAVTDVTIPLPHEPWLVCSSSLDGTVRLWDCRAADGQREVQKYVAGFAKEFASATLGGGNDHLVVGAQNEQVVFWDRRVGTGLEVFEDSHSEDVTRVRFQPGRRNRLFTAGVDGLTCAFDVGGCPADINDEDGLMTVMHTGCAIVEMGFVSGAGDNDVLWLLTGNEDAWFYDASDDAETVGNTLAYVPDTRGAAQRSSLAAGIHAGGLSQQVDYLVGCFSRKEPGGGSTVMIAAGTQGGAVGVYPVVTTGEGSDPASSPAVLGAPVVVMDGGHVDIVRAMAWVPDNTSEVPVTGAEDSRVCVWGEKTAVDPGGDNGYIQAGGKIGREDEGGRRHSPY